MPTSTAQATGRVDVIDVTVLKPAGPVAVAGLEVENSPYVRAEVEYWVGSERYPKFFTVTGYANHLNEVILGRLPLLPSCVPVS